MKIQIIVLAVAVLVISACDRNKPEQKTTKTEMVEVTETVVVVTDDSDTEKKATDRATPRRDAPAPENDEAAANRAWLESCDCY